MTTLRHLLLALLVPGLAALLPAASETDMGQGLFYARMTGAATESGSLDALLTQHRQLILDLRSLPAPATSLPAALARTLGAIPKQGAVVFVLINPTTSPDLIAAVSKPGLPRVITIGPASPAVTPDIAVSTTEEKDRLVHDVITKGTAPDTLINGNREKRRFDEARLVQNHANGTLTTDEALDSADSTTDTAPKDEGSAPASKAGEKKPEAAPLLDLVLSRAVQLHRALLATKQL